MQKIIAVIIGVVVIGGGAFYSGMKYTQSKNPAVLGNSQTGGVGFSGRGGARGTRGNGGGAGGSIIAKDDTSVTIQLQDGGSQIVFFTGATPVSKSVSGSASDLTTGERVMVIGTKNQDGSINAQSIQIRPPMRPDTAKANPVQ